MIPFISNQYPDVRASIQLSVSSSLFGGDLYVCLVAQNSQVEEKGYKVTTTVYLLKDSLQQSDTVQSRYSRTVSNIDLSFYDFRLQMLQDIYINHSSLSSLDDRTNRTLSFAILFGSIQRSNFNNHPQSFSQFRELLRTVFSTIIYALPLNDTIVLGFSQPDKVINTYNSTILLRIEVCLAI